jgi:hypothetical protein
MVLKGDMTDGTDFLTERATPASPIQEYRTGLVFAPPRLLVSPRDPAR